MRTRLPNRRASESFKVRFAEYPGIEYTVTLGYGGADPAAPGVGINDGRPAKVFIDCNKLTTAMDTAGRDTAVLISIALQYGADIDDLRKSVMRDEYGAPRGIAGAVLDAIAERMVAK